MGTNDMTVEQIAQQMARHAFEGGNGMRSGRFIDDGDSMSMFDGEEPDPNEAAEIEHSVAMQEHDESAERTDYRPDQARDEKGRFIDDGGGGGASGGGGGEAKSHEGGTGGDHGGAGAKPTRPRNEKGHFVKGEGSEDKPAEAKGEGDADKPKDDADKGEDKDKPEGGKGGHGGGGGHDAAKDHVSSFIDFLNKPLEATEGGHAGGGGGEGGEGHEKRKGGHGIPSSPKPVPAPHHDIADRTDWSPDQPRDAHGRFGEGALGVDGKQGESSASGVGREGGTAKSGGSLSGKDRKAAWKTAAAAKEAVKKEANSIARPADPKAFHEAFEKQMKDSPFKAFVTHYTPEQLAAPDMKTLISKNGTAGVAIHDHGDGRVEGTALWSNGTVKGEGIAMLKEAVANHGVNYCECYAGTLDKFYAGVGFVEESRSPFNREYASPDWDYERFGTPDYVTMRHPG